MSGIVGGWPTFESNFLIMASYALCELKLSGIVVYLRYCGSCQVSWGGWVTFESLFISWQVMHSVSLSYQVLWLISGVVVHCRFRGVGG